MTLRHPCTSGVVSGLSRTVAAALLLLTAAGQIAAQSLGDVARREAERRKQATSGGRVYTNGDLAPVDPSAPPAAAPIPVEAAPGSGGETPATPAPTQEARPANNGGVESVIVKGREKRDEQYWRTSARDVKGRLAKVNAGVAAQQARLAEIDAGPQTPTTVREREVISTTLVRLQRDAGFQTEELTRFVTRAQMAKIPDAWFR